MKRLILLGLLALAAFPAQAQNVTTPAVAAMVCANNTVVPTPTDGQFFYVQCDSSGRLLVTGASPSGAAGGDLSGTYPDPNVIAASTNAAASVPSFRVRGTIFTGGTGTTTFPQILIQPTGTSAVTTWSTSGTVFGANVVSGFAGNFLDFHVAGAASVFSVSAAGALNVVAVAASGNVRAGAGSVLGFNSSSVFTAPSDGVLKMSNAAQSDFSRLQFGGTTSSFPALKRSTTLIQARLADDSAFTNIQGLITTDTNYTAGVPVTTGYITLYDATGSAYKVPACLASGC